MQRINRRRDTNVVLRVDEEFPADIRYQLTTLLRDLGAAFYTGESNLGRTHVMQHEIKTGNARPTR
jgi:hypothetical protein